MAGTVLKNLFLEIFSQMKEIATASLNVACRADKITTNAYYCSVGFIIIATKDQMVWSSPRANAGKKPEYYSRAAQMPTKKGRQTKGLKQGGGGEETDRVQANTVRQNEEAESRRVG